jgi:SAM-dependent methyltransferase
MRTPPRPTLAAMSHDEPHAHPPVMDEAFWDDRYQSASSIWSGHPNPHLVTEAADLPPGRALEVGAGEGADAIWLAEHGWQVTAVDISAVALARGAQRAVEVGVGERITWQHADLLTWSPPVGAFELVTVHFLHLPPQQRTVVYAALATAVAPGGILLAVGHHPSDMDAGIGRPPWREMYFTAGQLAADLDDGWEIIATDTRARSLTGPDGEPVTIHDAVLVARRSA